MRNLYWVGVVMLVWNASLGASNSLPEQLCLELVGHSKKYYAAQEREALAKDKWAVELRHNYAKKRMGTQEWPTVNRKDFLIILEDVNRQFEDQNQIVRELLVQTSNLITFIDEQDYEDDSQSDGEIGDEVEIDLNDEFLRKQARKLQKHQGFIVRERNLNELENFKRYLEKFKLPPLKIDVSLQGFYKYLGSQEYAIPENYKDAVDDYLKQYIFGD